MMPGLGPITCRLAAYRAGQPPGTPSPAAIAARVSPATTVYRAGPVTPGSTSTVPACSRPGSRPRRGRLAAYSAGQPPGTANRAAMPDSVSPGCTAYRAAAGGRAAATAAGLTALGGLTALVRTTSGELVRKTSGDLSVCLSVRVLAVAG